MFWRIRCYYVRITSGDGYVFHKCCPKIKFPETLPEPESEPSTLTDTAQNILHHLHYEATYAQDCTFHLSLPLLILVLVLVLVLLLLVHQGHRPGTPSPSPQPGRFQYVLEPSCLEPCLDPRNPPGTSLEHCPSIWCSGVCGVSCYALSGLATLPLTKGCLQSFGAVQVRTFRSVVGWVRIENYLSWQDIMVRINNKLEIAIPIDVGFTPFGKRACAKSKSRSSDLNFDLHIGLGAHPKDGRLNPFPGLLWCIGNGILFADLKGNIAFHQHVGMTI